MGNCPIVRLSGAGQMAGQPADPSNRRVGTRGAREAHRTTPAGQLATARVQVQDTAPRLVAPLRSPRGLATTISRVGSIPARSPVRVVAISAGSTAIQRITAAEVELCDRDNVLTAAEIADYATEAALF